MDAQNSDAEARLRYKFDTKSMRIEYADGVPRSDGEMTTPTSPNRDPTVVPPPTHRKKKMNSFGMRRFFYDPTMIFYLF